MEKRQTTSSIKRQPDAPLRASPAPAASPYEEILDAMPVPALLLTPAGIIGAPAQLQTETKQPPQQQTGEHLARQRHRGGQPGQGKTEQTEEQRSKQGKHK